MRRASLRWVRGKANWAADGWSGCADPETTLAVYMGRDAAGPVAARLIAEGRAPHTPAVAVENAGRPEARLIRTTLAGLAPALAAAAPSGPVVMVIGPVAARARTTDVALAEPVWRSRQG